jgi:selenocysteine-specific elongation factor
MDVRVKGIRAHDETVESARAGQRVALNIAGKLQAASIARGDWLVEPEAARSTKRLDVEFTLLPNAPFPLKHLAPVKLYIGAKRIAGRLALLDTGERHDSAERGSNRLLPGTGCLAQLILDGDIACVRGERFLLRDHAENVILGGGIILDPAAPQSGKSRPARIAWLKGMQAPSPAAALAELVAQDQLIELQRFRHTWNLREDEAVEPLPVDSRHFSAEGRQWLVSTRRWRNAEQLLLGLIAQWHREQPQLRGIKMTELHRSMAQHCESALTMAVLIAHLETGDLVLHEGHIRRAEFQATESAEAIVNWNQVQQCLEQCGRNIPLLSELCARCALSETDLHAVVKTATKSGKLIRINAARYAQPEQLMVFARDVISCDSNSDMLSIANLKSRFGSGRKLTVEIMEYFDSVHFTRRQGEARVILHAEVPGKLFQT